MKEYNAPYLKVVYINSADCITTSGDPTVGIGYGINDNLINVDNGSNLG